MTKEKLLSQLNPYITQCSNLNPPPVDYIARLQEFKAAVQIATPLELVILEQEWRQLTATCKNISATTPSSDT